MYHYAGNNPVRYIDPDGEVPILATVAAAGFLIGAGVELVNQFIDIVSDEGRIVFVKFDGKKILIQGFAGTASLMLASTGIGLSGQIVGNAVIGCISDCVSQISDGKEINGREVLAATMSGAVAGVIGGAGDKQIGAQLNRLNKRILSAIKYRNFREIRKAISYFSQNTQTLVERFRREAFKDGARDIVPNKIIDDFVNEVFTGASEDE